MIARVWSAQTTPELAPAYAEHLNNHVLPAVRKLAGFAGANLLQRPGGEAVEIVVITYWQSMDAIRGFAGSDLERAVVADEASALLTRYDERVRHYEVVLNVDGYPATPTSFRTETGIQEGRSPTGVWERGDSRQGMAEFKLRNRRPDTLFGREQPTRSLWSQILFIVFGAVAGFFIFGCVSWAPFFGIQILGAIVFEYTPFGLAGFVAGAVLCALIVLLFPPKGKRE
jgi:heme-degrading monooxygenase HmoA